MAYVATVTTVKKASQGRNYVIVTIEETGARDTSEATIPGVPVLGRIIDVSATKTAGTGTTVDPEIGTVVGWTDLTQGEVWQNGAAAAHIDAQPAKSYYSPTGTLYLRSSVNNVATDHSISTQIIIAEGAGA